MREIKFRAWNKIRKVMSYDVTLYANGWVECVFEDGSEDKYPPKIAKEILVIMQFIGLKDKNGKEIYEGDIVKLVSTEWANDDPIIDVVEWGLGDRSYPAFDLKKFSYETEMNSFSYIFNSGYYEIEVIGNIYENPELLKEESK